MDAINLLTLLTANYENRAVTEIIGPPGSAKSAIVAAWADEMNRRFGGAGPADVRRRGADAPPPAFGLIACNLSALDVPDVAGVGIPVHETDGLVMRAARPIMWPVPELHGERGVLFLDEFRSADDSVRKPTSTLLLEGWLNGRSLPPGWCVVLASNRQSDNSGAFREFAMLNNRRCVVTLTPTYAAWAKWAFAVRFPGILVSFAEKHSALVFTDAVPDHDGPFCTPRSFAKAAETWVTLLTGAPALDADGRFAEAAGSIRDWLPEARATLIQEAVAGWVGDAVARQLFVHVAFAKEMPDLADILADPAKAKVPSRMDARFVVGHMLVHHVTVERFPALLRYAERLGDDLCVAFARNSVQRCPQVFDTPAYTEWTARNARFISALL